MDCRILSLRYRGYPAVTAPLLSSLSLMGEVAVLDSTAQALALTAGCRCSQLDLTMSASADSADNAIRACAQRDRVPLRTEPSSRLSFLVTRLLSMTGCRTLASVRLRLGEVSTSGRR